MFRTSSGFPRQLYTKLNYVETFQLVSTSGSIATRTIHANSLFDPDVTGVGKQPYYFDQFAALYNAYCVYGSKIKIIASSDSAASSKLIVRPTPDATAIADMDLECERPSASCVIVRSGATPRLINRFSKTKNVMGAQGKFLDDDYASLVTTNPTNTWFWQIATAPHDEVSTSLVNITVKVTYYARFFDRKGVSAS